MNTGEGQGTRPPVRHGHPTTERVTLDEYMASEGNYVIYSLHSATYSFAEGYVPGKDVLDLGCGTGYGTSALAPHTRRIVGVDISAQAIDCASERFAAPNLSFVRIDPVEVAPLPFEPGSFDVVVSFQVMEHVDDVATYLDEIRRVLRPRGTFLCVTPDRTHRLFRGQRPWNEFHRIEFSPTDVHRWLATRFSTVEMLGMSARAQIIDHELGRYRRMRLLSYPFTFPGAPERWRLAGIRLAKRLIGHRASSEVRNFDFGPKDIEIAADAAPSVNVVAVASGDDPATAPI
jgi:SAM-dependent methyltransferase